MELHTEKRIAPFVATQNHIAYQQGTRSGECIFTEEKNIPCLIEIPYAILCGKARIPRLSSNINVGF